MCACRQGSGARRSVWAETVVRFWIGRETCLTLCTMREMSESEPSCQHPCHQPARLPCVRESGSTSVTSEHPVSDEGEDGCPPEELGDAQRSHLGRIDSR